MNALKASLYFAICASICGLGIAAFLLPIIWVCKAIG